MPSCQLDLFGLPARYRLIENLAKKHSLILIEDAAQGFGGQVKGKKAGSFGNSTSFFQQNRLGAMEMEEQYLLMMMNYSKK